MWRTACAAVLVLLCAVAAAPTETVTVSAAASTKEAMTAIGKAYEAATGVHVSFNFDASGKLAQQIEQGAPVDALVSAADGPVDGLVKAGVADPATRRVVAGNTLVLVVPADAGADAPKSFADLVTVAGKVAVGDPKSVPAGTYAAQTLAALHLTDAVKPRLVYGTNVRQVLAYVRRGEVAAGIVYGTDAKEAGAAVRVVATADPKTHDRIEYPAVAVKGAVHAAGAKRFLDYLGTPAARKVLVEYGFTVPDEPATRPAGVPASGGHGAVPR